MAMIKCHECGKEISEFAEACPHCGAKTSHGYRVQYHTAKTKRANLLFIIGSIAFVVFIFALVVIITDINHYYGPGYGGYNYVIGSGFTDHETTMLTTLVLSGAVSSGCIAGLIVNKKGS